MVLLQTLHPVKVKLCLHRTLSSLPLSPCAQPSPFCLYTDYSKGLL